MFETVEDSHYWQRNKPNCGYVFDGFLITSDVSDRDVVCAFEEEHLIDSPNYEKSAALSHDVGAGCCAVEGKAVGAQFKR